MTKLTLGLAAREAGISKPTLSKAIKDGRLSAERQDDGSYAIDPSELARYLEAFRPKGGSVGQRPSPDESGALQALKRENELLREILERERADRLDERRRAEAEIEHLRLISERLLPGPRKAAEGDQDAGGRLGGLIGRKRTSGL
ncbi:hypothetical protein RDV64_23790 (plasmid) [Acuticoccus sp. MNP-M23]|uniref:hypothetical protein n=1 Tax=Acuticoccus sp. MNP-M23 TaxID=3072793 RepID=UPI002815D9F7|nr:hypothetical protein [Acuticoccus sp. MNP-M23]WMS45378.1 hypothetical protein RDV64_23790 [Acuticoccus sp. MNP-M23]